MKDPIVDEIRQIRKKHANRFYNDLDSIFNDIIKHQKQYSNRLVRLKAHKLKPATYKKNTPVHHMASEKQAEYNAKKPIEENRPDT